MKIYAHRGFSYAYPEASRVAYEKGIELGVDGLECDIRLTSDGVPICFHDRTTERIAGIKRTVSKLSYREIKELVDVITLDELMNMAVANGTSLLIETKHPVRSGGKVEVEVLKRVNGITKSRITLMSFSLLATLRFSRRYADVAYVISKSWRTFFIPTNIVAVDIELYRRSKFVRDRLAGKEIFLWTVNDPRDIPRVRKWEVAGVITDRPDLGF